MVQLSLLEQDAPVLRDMLDAKLRDLRREISHTDSPRFRETLYRVEGMLEGLLAQLAQNTIASVTRSAT